MPTITVGPNSLRFINGGAVVTTYATLYPTGYKQVAGNKRVGTWNCPVRGCANHNGQGYSSESSVRNHMTSVSSGHGAQCLQDMGDQTFVAVQGAIPSAPAPAPVAIAPAPAAVQVPQPMLAPALVAPQLAAVFGQMNGQMAAFGRNLAVLNGNFVAVNANMAGFNNQLAGVNHRLAGYDHRFLAAENRLDRHDARFQAHGAQFQAHDSRLDGLCNRVEAVEEELARYRAER